MHTGITHAYNKFKIVWKIDVWEGLLRTWVLRRGGLGGAAQDLGLVWGVAQDLGLEEGGSGGSAQDLGLEEGGSGGSAQDLGLEEGGSGGRS